MPVLFVFEFCWVFPSIACVCLAILSIFLAHLYQLSKSLGGVLRFMILLCNFTRNVSLKMSTMTADFLSRHDLDRRVAKVVMCLSMLSSYFILRFFILFKALLGEL